MNGDEGGGDGAAALVRRIIWSLVNLRHTVEVHEGASMVWYKYIRSKEKTRQVD